MLPAILLIAACLIAGLLVLIWMQPADFAVSRTAVMGAPPGRVHAEVNDFKRWRAWSPWETVDPDLHRTYAGPPEGPGAVYEWSGNNKAGKGRMTITDSKPGERILIHLEFTAPMKATNTTEFRFAPENGGTRVTWTMRGHNANLLSKAFSLFFGMDKMVGGSFEQGLANMRNVVEADSA